MECDLIPEHILNALKKRGLSRVQIENSNPEFIFTEYLEWLGFYGYSDGFISDIDKLRSAQKAK